MTRALKIVFMGTPDFSVKALDALVAAGHDIAAIYTQPPRPAGRGMDERKSPVHEAADQLGVFGMRAWLQPQRHIGHAGGLG